MKDFTRFGIVLAWLVALGGPFAQRAAAADADFLEAKKHIQQKNSKITDATLEADLKVVRGATEDVKRILAKKGKKEIDVDAATILTWKMHRIGPNALNVQQKLDKESFLKPLLQAGFIDVESDPDGADVFIDEIAYSKKSNTTVVVSPGDHKVRAQKGGKSDEKGCTVEEDKSTPVTLKLR